MNMTHPDILRAEITGGIEKPIPQCFICFLCGNDFETYEPLESNGRIVCPDCSGLSRKEMLWQLVELKEQLIVAEALLTLGAIGNSVLKSEDREV